MVFEAFGGRTARWLPAVAGIVGLVQGCIGNIGGDDDVSAVDGPSAGPQSCGGEPVVLGGGEA